MTDARGTHPSLEVGREPPPLLDAETAITGERRRTDAGEVWIASAHYSDLHRHGRAHVAAARAWDPARLAVLARLPSAAAIPPEGWAFLDVESTGLGAHAGVYAFLVGIGWLGPDGFRVEQVLLRDPDEEPALLAAVAERLAGFAGVVTFNGKSFDVPLLATRYALRRRPAPHGVLVHCDLLPVARRTWAERTANCRLATLESGLLGLRRQDDTESRLVPQIYLDYLRDGRGDRLDPVLAHNRADLLSLALLTAEAVRFLERAEAPDVPYQRLVSGLAADRLRAARAYDTAGEPARATALLERCLAAAPPDGVRRDARMLLGWLHKRQANLEAACAQWEALLTEAPELVEPYEELAKVLEHRRRDPAGALAWVERRLAGSGLDAAAAAALRHRHGRLARKLGRPAPASDLGAADPADRSPDGSRGFPLASWSQNC